MVLHVLLFVSSTKIVCQAAGWIAKLKWMKFLFSTRAANKLINMYERKLRFLIEAAHQNMGFNRSKQHTCCFLHFILSLQAILSEIEVFAKEFLSAGDDVAVSEIRKKMMNRPQLVELLK